MYKRQVPYITASGGSITTDGDYNVHTFTSSGTFEVTTLGAGESESDKVDFLIIGGGGSGGSGYNKSSSYTLNGVTYAGEYGLPGGGGGAGGYRNSYSTESSGGGASSMTTATVSAPTYTVTVGAGGSYTKSQTDCQGSNGSDSSFNSVTGTGGGAGGAMSGEAGQTGGSGGGGTMYCCLLYTSPSPRD